MSGWTATTSRPRRNVDERPRRFRTLLSFQRSVPGGAATERPPTRARGPRKIRYRTYPSRSLGRSGVELTGLSAASLAGGQTMLAAFAADVSRNGADTRKTPLSRLHDPACRVVPRDVELGHDGPVDLDAPL